jgi:hypothetical protein
MNPSGKKFPLGFFICTKKPQPFLTGVERVREKICDCPFSAEARDLGGVGTAGIGSKIELPSSQSQMLSQPFS